MRALLIEDEPELRANLRDILEREGFVVDAAGDGAQGLYIASEYAADIAIIDLGLPGVDGMEIIRKVRASGRDYPILILTARDGWEAKVEGLECGADDYLVKPFHRQELLARLRALVRRAGGWAHPVMRCGPIELNSSSQYVSVSGRPVDLTAYEYRLLQYLMTNAGRVVSKTDISEHLYAEDDDRDSNVIEVFIRRLRSKLDPTGEIRPIETLRGRGYRWALPRE